MKKNEYNADVEMVFSPDHHWHSDIWLPRDAQISEIHLRVYSFGFPDYTYGISWGILQTRGDRMQIPIEAFKHAPSSIKEAVHLAVDITYYTESE